MIRPGLVSFEVNPLKQVLCGSINYQPLHRSANTASGLVYNLTQVWLSFGNFSAIMYCRSETQREEGHTGENTHSALYPHHICYSNRNGILLSCIHVYLWMHLGCMAHLILLLTSTAKLEVRTLGNSSVQIQSSHSTAQLGFLRDYLFLSLWRIKFI